jgi:hypothetical protein
MATFEFINAGADANDGDNWQNDDLGTTGTLPGIGDTIVNYGVVPSNTLDLVGVSLSFYGHTITGNGTFGPAVYSFGPSEVTINAGTGTIHIDLSQPYGGINLGGHSSTDRFTWTDDLRDGSELTDDPSTQINNVIVTGNFSWQSIQGMYWSNIHVLGSADAGSAGSTFSGMEVEGTSAAHMDPWAWGGMSYSANWDGIFHGLCSVDYAVLQTKGYPLSNPFSGDLRGGMAITDNGSVLFYDTTAMNLPPANKVLAPASGGPANFGPDKTPGTYVPPASGVPFFGLSIEA